MTIIETKVKRWGNSFGIIIPRETIEKEAIREEDKIKIILVKNSKKVLKSTFGIAKQRKISGQEFKDEARRELYN
jgi:antitoxin component of MazEF toxin-antitoxin module